MKLVTVSEMKQIEEEANQRGWTYEQMMEKAGHGLAEIVDSTFGMLEQKVVTGLVGTGNNGGDTLVALTELAARGWKANACMVRPRTAGDPLVKRFTAAGGNLSVATEGENFAHLDTLLHESGVLLDGVLGTGARLPLKPEIAKVLGHVADFEERPFVVAVDCPSGVDCASGEMAPETISADLTVCMAAYKTGLLRFPAYEACGVLEIVDIGLPDGLEAWDAIKAEVAGEALVASRMPARPMDAHKGTFGSAMVVAGSITYTGAALLAGKAAYRSGAGLVRMAIPGPLHTPLAGQLPEATWLILPHEMGVISEDAEEVLVNNLDRSTAMLLGPGWGTEETTGAFLRKLIEGRNKKARRSGAGFFGNEAVKEKDESGVLPPLVIDADGLRLLAGIPDWQKKLPSGTILTPHPGEMAVLTRLKTEEIQAKRLENAQRFAAFWDCVVVLKGALTVIAAPDGRICVIPVATPALARAGSGDVLAGLITGLRAQGMEAYDAAVAGAWLHARAGLMAEAEVGNAACVLAGDVLNAIPQAFTELSEE